MNIFQKFITSKLLKFVFIAVLAIQLIGLPAIPLASDFDLDPSVVLYLPFYKYGTEIGSKIFDESQYGNHGTIVGAVPAQIPMLLGVELVANGAFETDPNVEWSPVDGTIALVAGGQSGNCLEITRVAEAVQSARQAMTRFVIGKRYKISGWVKSGTSGNEEFQIGDTWHGLIWITGTSSATWTYYETIFIATFGAEFMFALVKNSATPGTMLFDQVSIQEVVGYTGGQGWQFDGVGNKVDCGNNISLQMTDYVSVLAWIFPRSFNTDYQRIVCKEAGGGSWAFNTRSDGSLNIYAGTSNLSGNANDLVLNKWQLVAMTFVGGGQVYGYVNGDVKIDGAGTALTDTVWNLLIGIRTGGSLPFNGSIDEVTIYNKALSAQEIRNIYELTRHRYGR